jgi:hypothetical protein
MKQFVAIAAVSVLLLVASGQANAIVLFGPGPHWVDTVLQSEHTFPSKGVFDLQIIGGPVFPGITLYGPTTVWNSDAYDGPDSPGSLDPDHKNMIDTEIVSMSLTGMGGVTLTAGDGVGNGLDDNPWMHSPGWIEEIVADPYDQAESHFNVRFTVTLPPALGGMTLYNPVPHPMRATITELPPQVFVYISYPPGTQTELWDEANPSGPVAIITTATHSPEPSTLVLLAIGGVGLLGYSWRRRR